MSRDIHEDLEVDAEQADRLDRVFADVLRLHQPDATDHASRIVALADAAVIGDIELVD